VKRTTWVSAAVAVLVAAVVSSCGGHATSTPQTANTVTVKRGDLSSLVSLDGILTYRARSDGLPYSAINRAGGIYTQLPDAGDKVDCGDVLYRVDDKPVLLMCGSVPAYRDLAEGDHGQDVRQLNRNLRVPDGKQFTWKTAEALKGLQHDTGLHETGSLDLGDAVFLPKSVRIAKVTAELGGSASPGAQIAQATSDTLEVQVNLDAAQQGGVKEGERAQITLPANKSVSGRVKRLGRVAQAPAGQDAAPGAATIPASIALDEPKQANGLDQAPVQVDIATKGVKNVLSVPVTALVGKSGGGYAVEVVRDDGESELIAVTLGLFDTAAGRVEVEGDLAVGDDVVVPSS
jgi:hypothetical protein